MGKNNLDMNTIHIVLAVLSIIIVTLVLVQERSSGAGGLFGGGGGGGGGSGEFYQRRRGIEKILFISTVIAVGIFTLFSVLNLVI